MFSLDHLLHQKGSTLVVSLVEGFQEDAEMKWQTSELKEWNPITTQKMKVSGVAYCVSVYEAWNCTFLWEEFGWQSIMQNKTIFSFCRESSICKQHFWLRPKFDMQAAFYMCVCVCVCARVYLRIKRICSIKGPWQAANMISL